MGWPCTSRGWGACSEASGGTCPTASKCCCPMTALQSSPSTALAPPLHTLLNQDPCNAFFSTPRTQARLSTISGNMCTIQTVLIVVFQALTLAELLR